MVKANLCKCPVSFAGHEQENCAKRLFMIGALRKKIGKAGERREKINW